MKRPFGLIGLVYLSVLTVVFYCDTDLLRIVVFVTAGFAVLTGAVAGLKMHKKLCVKLIAAGAAGLVAVSSFILFQNYIEQPIIDNYSEKEIYVEGFICDEPQLRGKATVLTVQTEKIDGQDFQTKLSYSVFGYNELETFDVVGGMVSSQATEVSSYRSKGIFLTATEGSSSLLKATGEKRFTPYTPFVRVRQLLKRSLDNLLNTESAALAKAVLLGDKYALEPDTRAAFTQTGTSYLIVVSGMHLTIVTLFIRFLLRKLRVKAWVTLLIVAAFVAAFAAITGFAPSVVRAGIMMLMIHSADCVWRQADGVNSLGVAALLMTATNPFLVGDLGMLFSFSATFGILLWADPITDFCVKKLHLTKKTTMEDELLWRDKAFLMFRRGLKRMFELISTSLAATLWVLPVSIIFCSTVSPLTVLISIPAYPLTCAVLLLSFPLALLNLLPFMHVVLIPLAAVVNWLSGLLVAMIKFFAKWPVAQIDARDWYWLIWLAVTALLVIVGYLIHAKRQYIAVTVSVLTLTIGGSLTCLFAENNPKFTVVRYGSGYTVGIEHEGRLSLLSCGGDQRQKNKNLNRWKNYEEIDTVIIPSENNRNINMLENFCNRFAVSQLYLYANENEYPYLNTTLLSDSEDMTLMLNDETADKVIVENGMVFQYVYSRENAVLMIPDGADCADIPESMRCPGTVLLEGKVSRLELIESEQVVSVSEKTKDDAECTVIESGGELQIEMR